MKEASKFTVHQEQIETKTRYAFSSIFKDLHFSVMSTLLLNTTVLGLGYRLNTFIFIVETEE